MFIPKTPAENAVSRSYLYDAKATAFENQYILLNSDTKTFLDEAQHWNCPNSKNNRQILSSDNWRIEHEAFLAYGANLVVNAKAQLCGTFHNFGTSYLVWLEFTGPDKVVHKLDCFIKETTSNLQVMKVIDGIECEAVYIDIITKGFIDPSVARKLGSIGSITWQNTAEAKTQYKLNSFVEQKCFERAAAECPFVELRQLDCFDDFLYRGDPGCLADYDLTLILENGTRLTTRIDLKLLNNLSTLPEQQKKAHDAELLIAAELLTDLTNGYWVKRPKHATRIEHTQEFQKLIQMFEAELEKNPYKYINIHSIDINTGRVIYNFFN